MNMRLLIDSIVHQTTVLIAQLATAAGVRAPLSHVANQVFLELVEALEAQGVGKKVAADMFGMALRSYQQKIQRLSESATDRGESLWQAVYGTLVERQVMSRAQIAQRFCHDEDASVRGILHDLVEAGLVYRSGRGDATLYRVVAQEELGERDPHAVQPETAQALLWITLYRQGARHPAQLSRELRLPDDLVEQALQALVRDGRAHRRDDGAYTSPSCVLPLGEQAGWEAALFDHYQAVVTAIAHKVRNGQTRALPQDKLGGSTYSFDLWQDHPYAPQVYGLLAQTRQQLSTLWDQVHAHNQAHERGPGAAKLTFYFGQNIQMDDAPEGRP